MKRLVFFLVIACALIGAASRAAEPAPLLLETKIPLGEVSGRIDHLAVDLGRQRLYLAELGNDSVGVIDLRERKTVRTLTGLSEPQGVGYVPATDTLYIANAHDGSVDLFAGADLQPAGRIELGDDADNIRVDIRANKVFVGYGSGALAVIDPVTRRKEADIPLKAHPEGFQLDAAGMRIFVNLPDARQIAVVDRSAGKVAMTMSMKEARANFPMAIDEDAHRVLVVFRNPARLMAFEAADGSPLTSIESCGDADDVFVDARRHRVYVSCGEGFIDVFAPRGLGYERIAHIATASGARTSLLVPELDRLFLAVRATGREPAAIWVYRPAP